MKIMRMFTFILAILILISTIPFTAFASRSSGFKEEWQSNGLVDDDGNLLPNGVKGIKKVSADNDFPDDPNRHRVEIQVESEAPVKASNGNLLFAIALKNEVALNNYKAILHEILPEILSKDSLNQVSIITLGDTAELLWEKGDYLDLRSILEAVDKLTPSSGIYLDKGLRMIREEFLPENDNPETFLMIDDVVGYSTKVKQLASSVYCGDNCTNPQWTVVPTEYIEEQIVGNGSSDKNGIHFARVSVPNATCNQQRIHSYSISSGKYPTAHSDVALSEAYMLLNEGGILYVYSEEIVGEQMPVYFAMASSGYYNNKEAFLRPILEKYGGRSSGKNSLFLKDTLSSFAVIDETTIVATSLEGTPIVEFLDGEIVCRFSGNVVLSYSFTWNALNPNFLRETEYSIGNSAEYPTTVNYIDELGEDRFISLNQPKASGFYGKIFANGYLVNYLMEPLSETGEVVADKMNAKVLLEEAVEIGNPNAGGENRWLPGAKVMVSPSSVQVEGHLIPANQNDETELMLEADKDSTIFFPLYKEYATLTIKYEFQADQTSAPPMQEVKFDNIKAGTILYKADIASFTETAKEEGRFVLHSQYELTENSIDFTTTQLLSNLEVRVFLAKTMVEPDPDPDSGYSFTLDTYKWAQNGELILIDEKESGEISGTGNQFIISDSIENLPEGYIYMPEEYSELIGNSNISYTLDKIFVNGIEKEAGQWFSLESGSSGNQIRVEYAISDITAKEVKVIYKLTGTQETQTQTLYNIPVDFAGKGVEGENYSLDSSLCDDYFSNYNFISIKLFEEGRDPREISFNLDQKTLENLSLHTENAYIEISFFAPYHLSYILYFDGVSYFDVYNVNYYEEEITFDKLVSKQDDNWREHYEVVEGLSANLPIPAYAVEDYLTKEKLYLEVYLTAVANLPYEIQYYEKAENGEYAYIKAMWNDAPVPPTLKIGDQSLELADLKGQVDNVSFFMNNGTYIREENGEDLFATITFNRNLFKLFYTTELVVAPPDPEDPNDPDGPGGELPSEKYTVAVKAHLLFDMEEVEEIHPYRIAAPVFLWQANQRHIYNAHEYKLSQVEVFKTAHDIPSDGVLSLGSSGYALGNGSAQEVNLAEMDTIGEGDAYIFKEDYDYTMKLYYQKVSFVGNVEEGESSKNNSSSETSKGGGGSYIGEDVDKAVLPVTTKNETVESKGDGSRNSDNGAINSTYTGAHPSNTLPRSGQPAELEKAESDFQWIFLYRLVVAEVVLIIPKRRSFFERVW